MSFPIISQQILDGDYLGSGWRGKANANFKKMIKNVEVTADLKLIFTLNDDTTGELDLSPFIYNKTQVNELGLSPDQATEGVAGIARIATIEEVIAGDSDNTFVTPAKMAAMEERKYAREYITSENLRAGDLVNVHRIGSGVRVRKAKADDLEKFACGFVKQDTQEGGSAYVFFNGLLENQTNLSPGKAYLLSFLDSGKPSMEEGPIYNQIIGFAVDDTSIYFNPQAPKLSEEEDDVFLPIISDEQTQFDVSEIGSRTIKRVWFESPSFPKILKKSQYTVDKAAQKLIITDVSFMKDVLAESAEIRLELESNGTYGLGYGIIPSVIDGNWYYRFGNQSIDQNQYAGPAEAPSNMIEVNNSAEFSAARLLNKLTIIAWPGKGVWINVPGVPQPTWKLLHFENNTI